MTPSEAEQARKEKLKATRKRLLEDFEFYARNCVKIRTKQGTIVPLVFNEVQRRFAKMIIDQMDTREYVRMVVLKARQQGLSTVISAWQYWWVSQRKAQKGLVMAHEADSTAALWDLYKRVHDNAPEVVKPHKSTIPRTNCPSTSSIVPCASPPLVVAAWREVRR